MNSCLPALQSSADKALDRLGEPLADWASLKPNLRITKRIKFLQRYGLGSLKVPMLEHDNHQGPLPYLDNPYHLKLL